MLETPVPPTGTGNLKRMESSVRVELEASSGHMATQTAEHFRLEEDRRGASNWKHWGPYVSERAWGTVREDYSPRGTAWEYFTHDHARSRAYRWGEDGLAGLCD